MSIKGKILSKNTTISISVGFGIAVASALIWVGKTWAGYTHDQESKEQAITQIRGMFEEQAEKIDKIAEDQSEKIQEVAADVNKLRFENRGHWTYQMMRAYTRELMERNPELNSPSTSEIRDKYIPHLFEPSEE